MPTFPYRGEDADAVAVNEPMSTQSQGELTDEGSETVAAGDFNHPVDG